MIKDEHSSSGSEGDDEKDEDGEEKKKKKVKKGAKPRKDKRVKVENSDEVASQLYYSILKYKDTVVIIYRSR